MRAQTPSAPTALTAYTPTPHGPYCPLTVVDRKFLQPSNACPNPLSPHRPHRLHPHPARPLLPPLAADIAVRKKVPPPCTAPAASTHCCTYTSAPTAHTPTPHGPYCLHSLLYIESSYRPPQCVPKPPPPPPPPPRTAASTHCCACMKSSYRPPPPPPPTPHRPYCLHSLLHIESSYRPPVRAQNPLRPQRPHRLAQSLRSMPTTAVTTVQGFRGPGVGSGSGKIQRNPTTLNPAPNPSHSQFKGPFIIFVV